MALKRAIKSNSLNLIDRNYIELRAKALLKNVSVITRLAPKQKIIAMVKADGYGHGISWVSKTLKKNSTSIGFGVATLHEAEEVRKSIGSAKTNSIYLFSGASPWSEQLGHFCKQNGVIPSINSLEDWKSFSQQRWSEKVPFMIKFNTGMNRMGIPLSSMDSVFRSLKSLKNRKAFSVYTHLASAEKPLSSISQTQLDAITDLRNFVKNFDESIPFHYANSSAIWNTKFWKLDKFSDWVRPGIALYGIPPWEGAKDHGIQPVMTARARILSMATPAIGEHIGYGATFTVKKKNFKTICVGMGYGDGLQRQLSNKGTAWHNGKTIPILGVISMDLCTLEATRSSKVGQWVEFIGENVDIWESAKLAGTIPYTLLTSISPRVMRRYG